MDYRDGDGRADADLELVQAGPAAKEWVLTCRFAKRSSEGMLLVPGLRREPQEAY